MIKFTNNAANFYSLRADFYDNGEPRTQYGDDRTYWEDMVGRWGHLSGLTITRLHPTPEQELRLAVLNNIEAENKENHSAECSIFVQHGVIVPDEEGCPFLQSLAEEHKEPTLNYFREQKRQEFKKERENRMLTPINNIQVGGEKDRERIQGAVNNWDDLDKNEDGTKNWVMYDNSVEPVTKEELEGAKKGYLLRVDRCFKTYENAVTNLYLAKTVNDILNVEMPDED